MRKNKFIHLAVIAGALATASTAFADLPDRSFDGGARNNNDNPIFAPVQPAETAKETTTTEPKAEEPKAEQPAEQPKAEETATPKDTVPSVDTPAKAAETDSTTAKPDSTKPVETEVPSAAPSDTNTATATQPNKDEVAPKAEEPKAEPKAEEPKAEAPKAEQPAPVAPEKGAGVVAEQPKANEGDVVAKDEQPKTPNTDTAPVADNTPPVYVTLDLVKETTDILKENDLMIAGQVDANTQAIKEVDQRQTARINMLEQQTADNFKHHEGKYSAGIASAMAFASIPTHTQGHHVGLGVGTFNGEQGVSLALTGGKDKFAYKLGLNYGKKEVSGAAGATFQWSK